MGKVKEGCNWLTPVHLDVAMCLPGRGHVLTWTWPCVCVWLLLLQCEDYKTAYEACHQLMQVNYSAAWVECKALAEAVDFSDVPAKQVICILQF